MARKKKKDMKLCQTCDPPDKVKCFLCGATQPARAIVDNWFHHERNNSIYHCCGSTCNNAVHQQENGYPYQ